MSRNEDYLDNLLNSVTTKLNEFDDDFEQNRESLRESYRTQNSLPSKTQSALDEMRGDNFLREYEADLDLDAEDDFIREFERELEGEADSSYGQSSDGFEDQMDQLLSEAQEQGAPTGAVSGNDLQDDNFEVDTLSGSDSALDSLLDGQTDVGADNAGEKTEMLQEGSAPPEGMEGLEDIFNTDNKEWQDVPAEPAPSEPVAAEPAPAPGDAVVPDAGMNELLNESDDEALADISKMLDSEEVPQNSQNPEDPFSVEPDFEFVQASLDDGQIPEKKTKEKNPNGLFAKLMRILFGTPEELDPEAAAKYEAEKPPELSPEELKEKKKQEKELKKQQKQEAKEQKKKEKDEAKAAKAAEKAAKPKKEKKPKQKDTGPKEPALPKVPVAIMWILALSLMIFILLGSSLVGYTTTVSEARLAFDSGDYVTAYSKLQGVKLKATEEEMYHCTVALAGIQTEIDTYKSLMEQKQYELALDALIRGMGRCQVHSAEAEEWGVTDQLVKMRREIKKYLNEQFDVSEKRAKKIYKIKKRTDYTIALQEILEKLDLI